VTECKSCGQKTKFTNSTWERLKTGLCMACFAALKTFCSDANRLRVQKAADRMCEVAGAPHLAAAVADRLIADGAWKESTERLYAYAKSTVSNMLR
jgi:hypothetical protein